MGANVVIVTADTAALLRVANDESVRPWITPGGRSTPLADPDLTGVLLLSNEEESALLVLRASPYGWQVHWLFTAACRGRTALAAGRAMLAHAKGLGINYVWGYTPRAYRHAIWFNRQLGGTLLATFEDEVLFGKEL